MNTEQLAARFESLERGMRRWRRLATVLVLGLVVAGTVAATRQERIPDVVKARAFEVVNKAGKGVVLMGAGGGDGVVVVVNKDGKGGVVLMGDANKDGGMVTVNNKAGKGVVILSVADSKGIVTVNNKAGKGVVTLSARPDGDGVVAVKNKAGKSVVLMVANAASGLMAVLNKRGKVVWQAPPK